MRVEVLVGLALRQHRVGAEAETHLALVELRDPHAGRLPHPRREDALVVRRVAQLRDRRSHLRTQGPDLDGVAALPFWDVDASHDRNASGMARSVPWGRL